MILKRAVAAVAVILMTLLLPVRVRAATVDRIVAVVNDEALTLSELRRRENPVLLRILSPRRFPEEKTAFEKAVLDDLIVRRLLLQKARELRIEADDKDIEAYLDGMTASNGTDRQRFTTMLKEAGIDMQDLRRGIAENIARSRLIHFEVRSRIVVTDDEAKKLYRDRYGDPAALPKGYHLLQMGFYWNRPGSLARTREEARRRAEEVHERVAAGEDFRDLARRMSELPTAGSGGDLGFISPRVMAPWMRAALAGLGAGALTPVVEGAGAMQFFLVMAVNLEGRFEPPPFRLVRQEIKKEMLQAREKKYLNEWLTKLKKEAYIRIML